MYEKRSISLCSTYVLPLIGLNRYSFGETNFVNSYLSEDLSYVVVELKLITQNVQQHPRFRFDFKEGSRSLAVFEMPEQYGETIRMFVDGKYSKFPEESKNIIRKRSGLRYNVPQPDGSRTSARELLALDKSDVLRRALERELSNPGSPVVIDHDAELMDIPGEREFFKLNVSQKLELTV